MSLSTVYSKTAKGVAEVSLRSDALTPAMRRVLIMVDGHRTAAELELVARDRDFESIVTALIEKGMIEPTSGADVVIAESTDGPATVAAQSSVAQPVSAESNAPAIGARKRSLGARVAPLAIAVALAGAGAAAWQMLDSPPPAAPATSEPRRDSAPPPPPPSVALAAEPPRASADEPPAQVAEVTTRVESGPPPAAAAQRSAAAPASRNPAPRTPPTAAAQTPPTPAPRKLVETGRQADARVPAPQVERAAAELEPPGPAMTQAPRPPAAPLPVAEPPSVEHRVAVVDAPAAATASPAKAAPPDRTLVPVAQPRPKFPAEALREGISEGRVLARLAVDADGRVRDVRILESDPPRAFDREVRSTVLRWRYQPPGTPRDVDVEFVFRVEG